MGVYLEHSSLRHSRMNRLKLGLFQNCRTVNGDYEVPHAVDEVDDKILDQYHFYLVVVLLDDLDNAGHLHEFGDHLAG